MGKGSCTFKETDVTRALRAAKKAGVEVQVTIDWERKTLTLTPVKPGEANAGNEWDEVLSDEKIAEVH
jgi:hypothetical protein